MWDETKEILWAWRDWYKRLPDFVKASFLLFLMCAGCSYFCDFTALLYGESWLDTELPAEAKNTRGMYWWGMQGSDFVQISFQIAPKDLEVFIEESCIEPLEDGYNPLSSLRKPGIFDPILERKGILAFMFGRWEPLAITHYAGSQGHCNDEYSYPAYRYSIVVDQDKPDLYTVYLQVVGRVK